MPRKTTAPPLATDGGPPAHPVKELPTEPARDAVTKNPHPTVRTVPDNPPEFDSLDDHEEHLTVLYYGAEGSGKTTAALQMSRLKQSGNILVINAEGGTKRHALAAQGVDTSRIKLWPKPGQPVTFAGMEALFYRLSADLEKDPESWLGTIWDSATNIHQEFLDQYVESQIAKQQAILEKAGAKARSGNIEVRDRFDLEGSDYGYMSNQFKTLLRRFRYLPCHFAVTALLRRDEDQRGKRVSYGPAVTPALQADLAGYVDMMVYCKVTDLGGSGRVFFAQTAPTLTERAKDRYGVLPSEVVNPAFDRLHSYATGAVTADTDPLAHLMRQEAMPEAADVADSPAADVDAAAAAAVTTVQKLATRPARKKTSRTVPPTGANDEPPF